MAVVTEAWGQEIIAIRTALAKVSHVRKIKLVTLKKSRDSVAHRNTRTVRARPRDVM